jgi:hypothetical protein
LQHKFQILRYWVEKRIPLGLSVDSELFTNVELVTWGEKMKAAADDKDAQKPTIAAPGAYKKDTKWRVWKEQFLNYMGTKDGQIKAPLSYILCPDDDPADEGNVSTNDFEWMVYLTPHQGLAYQYDNGMVYDELKALLANSTAFTWIRVHNRARNERADCLRGISDPICSVAKGIVLATSDYLNDFTKAALYIASTLNVMLININQKRNISNVNTKNRGKNKGGGKKLTRSYSPAEWRALSNEERKKVLEARAKAKADRANDNTNTGAGRNANNKRTTAAVNTQDSGSEEGDILVHAGNVAEVLRQKNVPNAPPADAGDRMSSRKSKSTRINMLSSKRLYPSQQSRCIAKLKGHIGYF